MGAGHHHHHVDADAGDAKVAFAVGLNLVLTVAQVIGGVLAGSLSLIADAVHNLSDAVALIIAFGARKIGRRPADTRMTFGYGRIEAVTALINYTTLIVVALYLIYEGILRIFEPSAVAGWIVVGVAGVALVIDLATAALTYRLSKTSMNIRAAFLHNMADALGSVAVIVAGTLVILFGWNWVDPLITLLIAGYLVWQAAIEMPPVIRLLMLGSPDSLPVEQVVQAICAQDGVVSVHHVHLWMMGEHENAFQAHVVLAPQSDATHTREAVNRMLCERFDLRHVTLQLEEAGSDCAQNGHVIGHA